MNGGGRPPLYLKFSHAYIIPNFYIYSKPFSDKPRGGRGAKDDLKPGDKIKKENRVHCVFFLSINSAYCKQT